MCNVVLVCAWDDTLRLRELGCEYLRRVGCKFTWEGEGTAAVWADSTSLVPCTLWLLFFFFSFPVRISLVGSPSWAPATCSLFDVPYPLPVISHRVLSRSILRPTQCTLMMFS